jgi:HD-GYP domain-containing protein (c-di-GMP phosphodiesterase class II)
VGTREERRLRRRATELAAASGNGLRGHARRVARLAVLAADALELDERARLEVEITALLHDVGKIALPYRLLNKSTTLDEREWALMRTHTVEGERLCGAAGFPSYVGAYVRATHERWDGRGYPDGLAGEAIPLAARVVFCADAFDAMTSARAYRAPLSTEEAVSEVRAGAGAQFDPAAAQRFAAAVERLDGRYRRTARDRDPRAPLAPAPRLA